MTLLILIGVLAVVGLYVMGVYNGLQQLKTQIVASIQEIGNQLKRQASLIPNLESSVKGYMKHEKDIFTMLTDARKSAMAAQESGKASDIDAAIQKMASVVPKLSVAIEDNPELKADTTVTRFMDELTDTADKLSYSRRSVIDLTANYNQKLVMFPSNIIAGLFGFKPEKGLDTPMTGSHVSVSDEETKDVKVNL
jgi:LemA protein